MQEFFANTGRASLTVTLDGDKQRMQAPNPFSFYDAELILAQARASHMHDDQLGTLMP